MFYFTVMINMYSFEWVWYIHLPIGNDFDGFF